jgi:hypothetical protein
VHRPVSESLVSTLLSCSMHKDPDRSCSAIQAGRLCATTPCATSSRQVFDEVAERDVVSCYCYSITGVYMFSRENHGAGLVSLASQLGLSCCRACSLALLLRLLCPLLHAVVLTCITLLRAVRVAAATLIVGCCCFSAAVAPHVRCLWKCFNSAAPQCPPLGPCTSCNLAARKVFIEILKPWAVACLQW